MSVNFPQNKWLSVKAIPQETFLILVRVNGTGIDAQKPIAFELTREKNSRLLSAIPTGDKSVKVSAIDEKGKLLAQGENQVNVEANKLNKVEVELSEVKATQIEEQCTVSFPASETVSDTLKRALESAGCKVEIK